jgi:hypothetical protein
LPPPFISRLKVAALGTLVVCLFTVLPNGMAMANSTDTRHVLQVEHNAVLRLITSSTLVARTYDQTSDAVTIEEVEKIVI